MMQTTELTTILVRLIIVGIIVYGVYMFLNMLNLPQPIKSLVLLVVAVIGLIFLANLFGIRV